MTEMLYLFLAFILYSGKENVSLRTVFHMASSGLEKAKNYQTTIEILSFFLEKLALKYAIPLDRLILFSSEILSECPEFRRQFDLAGSFLAPV